MKNVTITLGEDTAAWARVEAAKIGKSLSRYINDRLASDMHSVAQNDRKISAQREALDKFLSGPGWPGISDDLPSKEELYAERLFHRHERTALRSGSESSGKSGKSGRVARRSRRP
jgi:hypothetical protein